MAFQVNFIQELSGTSPTMNVGNGFDAQIELSGNTVITISGSISGDRGLIYIDNPSTHTLTISGTQLQIKNNDVTTVAWVHTPFGFQFDSNAAGGGTSALLSVPTNFTAVGISSTQIKLTWTDVTGESAYGLEVSSDNTAWSAVETLDAGTVEYIYTVGTGNTLRYFRIKSIGDGVTTFDSGYSTASAKTGTGANRTATLDTVAGYIGNYGLCKLRTAYAGAAIRVRRSSDNAEQDISFDGSGNLDVASFNTFVGAATGYITKWYDQSGNARDAVQATTTLQPELKPYQQNARPSIYYGGTKYLTVAASTSGYKSLHDGDATANFVAQAGISPDPNAFYSVYGNNAGSGNNVGASLAFDDRTTASRNNGVNALISSGGLQVVNDITNNVWTPNQFAIVAHATNPSLAAASRSDLYINNGARFSSNTVSNAASTANATYDLQIGALGNNVAPFTGYISEVNFFSVKLSDTDRDTLRDHQNTYYAVY